MDDAAQAHCSNCCKLHCSKLSPGVSYPCMTASTISHRGRMKLNATHAQNTARSNRAAPAAHGSSCNPGNHCCGGFVGLERTADTVSRSKVNTALCRRGGGGGSYLVLMRLANRAGIQTLRRCTQCCCAHPARNCSLQLFLYAPLTGKAACCSCMVHTVQQQCAPRPGKYTVGDSPWCCRHWHHQSVPSTPCVCSSLPTAARPNPLKPTWGKAALVWLPASRCRPKRTHTIPWCDFG